MQLSAFEMGSHKIKRALKGRKTRDPEAGFTLVEILVVLAIIGLIMGLVGPRVLNFLSGAKIKTAKIQIETLSASLDLFALDVGRYPTEQEGLSALIQKPVAVSVWNGPYVKGNMVPLDPWGHAYVYHAPGKAGPFDVLTLGASGTESTATMGVK